MSGSDATQFYDQHASLYDRATRLLDMALDRQRKRLLAHARGRVLDLAVGTGKNLPYYPPGCEVWGVDLAAGMLRRARRRAGQLGRPLALLQGEAAALPCPDGTFDTVVCTLAGCIFPDPVRVFRELRRVCAPDGQLLFLEHVRPAQPALAALTDALTPISAQLVGCHPNRDTVGNIRAAGLEPQVEAAGVGGILLSIVARP